MKNPSAFNKIVTTFAFALMMVIPSAFAQWKTETIEGGTRADVGQFSSLAVDASGNLHAVYYDATDMNLHYAFRAKNATRWDILVVDGARAGTYPSLAVDHLGHPHIAYNSSDESGLHYATFDGKKWHALIVDPIHTNYYTSIQLDSNDRPRISYYFYHFPNHDYALHLKYAYFDGNNWFIQTVDGRSGTGKFNSLALDRSGKPWISYSEVHIGELRCAVWNGDMWERHTADSSRLHNGSYVGLGNSLSLDSKGWPHIAYFDNSARLVRYTWFDGNTWASSEVVAKLKGEAATDRVFLRLDSHDRPYIAFHDPGEGALNVGMRKGKGSWTIESVDSDGSPGLYPSMAFGPGEVLYITYYEEDGHKFKLAQREPFVEGNAAAKTGDTASSQSPIQGAAVPPKQ